MMKKFKENSIVIREGEMNDEMYKIVSGKAAVYLNYGKEDEYLIGILNEQKCFGEYGPLCEMPALYTVVSVTLLLVTPIEKKDLEYFIKYNHTELFEMIHNMANNMLIMKKNIDMLTEELKLIKSNSGNVSKDTDKGANKGTNINTSFTIHGNEDDLLNKAYSKITTVSENNDLSRKESMQLHLLAEEMINMMRSVTVPNDSYFWIEEEEEYYKSFILHFVVKTVITAEKKEKLLSISSDSQNETGEDITRQIRHVIKDYLEKDESVIEFVRDTDEVFDSTSKIWSLSKYKDEIYNNFQKENAEWIKLQESIIANIADEIEIYIRSNTVGIIIYKSF